MPITTNAQHRNVRLDAELDQYAGGTLTIRTGAAPGALNAATGTVLATVAIPDPAFAAAAAGTKSKNASAWQDLLADATGVAAHFRMVAPNGAVMEGTVTATGGGGDMTVDNVNFAQNQPFTVTGFTAGSAA